MTKIPSLETVLGQLRAEGLVEAAAAEAALGRASAEPTPDPWYLRALTIAGAWVSANFMLSFLLGFTVLLESPLVFAGLGALLLGGALAMHTRVEGLYLQQIVFVVTLVGTAGLAGGIGAETESITGASLVVLAAEAVVFVFYRDFARRFVAVVAAVVAVCVVLLVEDVPNALHAVSAALAAGSAWLWLHEGRLVATGQGEQARPAAYGFVLCLLGLLVLSLLADATEVRFWWIDTAVIAGVLGVVEGRLLREQGIPPTAPPALILFSGTVMLAVLTAWAPGILAAVLVLTLGFYRGNRLVAGFAVAALAGYVCVYYYDLDLTLLEKSGVLAASGVLLIGLRLALFRGRHDQPQEVYG